MKTLYYSSYDTEGKILVKRDDTHTFDSTHLSSNALETYTNYEAEHTHDFYEISYVLSGAAVQVVNNIRYVVQKGDLICMNLTDRHAYYPLNNLIILSLLISPDIIDSEPLFFRDIMDSKRRFRLPHVVRFHAEEFIEVENVILTMERECKEKKPFYSVSLVHNLSLLFIYSLRAAESSDERGKKGSLTPILEYISEHLQDITLGDAAAYSSYNPSYFSKMFHDNLGTTFTNYVNQLRINEAMKLILTTNYSIENICYMVGYKEKKNFYALFKKHTGLTPSMLRKMPH